MIDPLGEAQDWITPRPALRGFRHINRYWDPHQERFAAKILPGQYYVTRHEEIIVTALGSCVSACIRDTVTGVGGMNHFMLPDDGRRPARTPINEDSARYGVFAMELLINEILKNGGQRENLEVKITGGGRMIANMSDVGRRNIDFVNDFLRTEGLAAAAEDLGGVFPRKVYYFPLTGKMMIKKLRAMHNDTITKREDAYRRDLRTRDLRGDVELFDGENGGDV